MKRIVCHGFDLAALIWLAALSVEAQSPLATPPPATMQAAPIPMDQLGVVAGKQ